jgi:hypothetical protein
MFKLFASVAVLGVANASGPELGCYFYQLPSEVNKVQAQLEIKSDSVMEFAVAFDAPKLKLPQKTIVCSNEPYRFDTTTSEMVIGETDLSACLQSLKDYTRGAVKTPLRVKWSAENKTLSTRIVIPLAIPKAENCVQFTTTAAPTSETTETTTAAASSAPLTEGPVTRADTTASATATTTTTKNAGSISVFSGLMLGAIIIALVF